MKKSFILILGLLLFCGQTFSQTKEQEAIKKVCLGETQAYANHDYDTWASYHVQSSDEQLSWNNADGSFGALSGWDAISKEMKEWFQSEQKDTWKSTSENFKFIIRGDMAFVSYSSASQNPDGKTKQNRDYKTLLKIKGEWKLLSIQAYQDYGATK